MSEPVDLSHIYHLRNNFTIIGLTGRLSSGCSHVASLLSEGFGDGKKFENPFVIGQNESRQGFTHNSYRKYRIIHQYAKENFKPYTVIRYKDVLSFFILQHPFEKFAEFLQSDELKDEFATAKLQRTPDFSKELEKLQSLKDEFDQLSAIISKIDTNTIRDNGNWENFHELFFGKRFTDFSTSFHTILKSESQLKRNKMLQVISNNLRKSGKTYDPSCRSASNIFKVVNLINDTIKCCRNKNGNERTQIVIDSLRNPFEIMFLKQRYSAFYTVAVNRDDATRNNQVISKFTMDSEKDRDTFLKEEYKGGEDSEFFKTDVAACIQQADIHISFLDSKEAAEKNARQAEANEKSLITKDLTSPYFSWPMQVLKYVSLISHPGLVTPSPEERCMQLAHTAKHNSGCISRHVGAAITDENYSVKAIGWNNTPEGQVPCVLRNAEDLISHMNDLVAFTDYEKKDPKFKKALVDNFEEQAKANRANLQGRNVCFCFKSLKNSCSEGKNQVHTRSLHAEESAFLQISKYGGTGIKGGKLFTTASPCELCAKKAYQLGIKVIYYIDPYPGISKEHILQAGTNTVEMRLFNGAIGSTYHWLYDPVMPYKDEMTLLLGNEVKDLTGQYEKTIDEQKKDIQRKENEIQDLKIQLEKMSNKALQ